MFVYVQNFSYLCKVKKKHTDIDRMVMESHYLESLERESSPSLSDMERQDYIDQINDLKASNRRLMDMIDTLKQTLDSVTASNKRNEELVVKLTAQIDQLQKMVKNLIRLRSVLMISVGVIKRRMTMMEITILPKSNRLKYLRMKRKK